MTRLAASKILKEASDATPEDTAAIIFGESKEPSDGLDHTLGYDFNKSAEEFKKFEEELGIEHKKQLEDCKMPVKNLGKIITPNMNRQYKNKTSDRMIQLFQNGLTFSEIMNEMKLSNSNSLMRTLLDAGYTKTEIKYGLNAINKKTENQVIEEHPKRNNKPLGCYTEENIKAVKELYDEGVAWKDILSRYGGYIPDWHRKMKAMFGEYPAKDRHNTNHYHKFNESEEIAIIKSANAGYTLKEMANKYNCDKSTIARTLDKYGVPRRVCDRLKEREVNENNLRDNNPFVTTVDKNGFVIKLEPKEA